MLQEEDCMSKHEWPDVVDTANRSVSKCVNKETIVVETVVGPDCFCQQVVETPNVNNGPLL